MGAVKPPNNRETKELRQATGEVVTVQGGGALIAGRRRRDEGGADGVETVLIFETLGGVPHCQERDHGRDNDEGEGGEEEGGHGGFGFWARS